MWNDNQSNAQRKRDDWIISINNTLAKVDKPSQLSIYKVPNKLLKEDAYTPSIVSIGPFHHNNKAMQAFEEHKQRYMVCLFMRISGAEKAKSTLQGFATTILELQEEARRCYSEKIGLDDYELAEILLVDGCFLLELFLKYSNIENHEEDTIGDPLINDAQTIATLQHDLALLENQIPFSVLETLFDIIKDNVPQPLRSSFIEHNVATLALLFFKSALGLSDKAIQSKSSKLSGKHLLDILHNFYLPKCETLDVSEPRISHKIPQSPHLQRSRLRDCATRLSKAGIRFVANTDDTNENLLDIKFDATNGVVTMRPFHIQEAITETIFRNLIAFEQCSETATHHIASYVFLMRSLLHSSHDVEILHEKGIIKNESSDGDGGGGEYVTGLFKSTCEGVFVRDSYFSKFCEDVNGYYYNRISGWHWRRLYLNLDDSWRTKKHKWLGYMSDLYSAYLKKRWRVDIAAVLLLLCTALQTYYAIYSYYK